MADYIYAADGKTHTRFSHFARMTPNQIDGLVAEMRDERTRAETEDMSFGSLRHASFEAEARETGKVAAWWGINAPADYIEQEFVSEAFPGVIVHSRPDVVSVISKDRLVIYDYKTVVDGKQGWKYTIRSYRSDIKRRQLYWYAWQLGLHGLPATHGCYLFEIWNKDRTEILGYETMEFPITFRDMAAVVNWAKERVALLQVALDEQLTP